MSIQHAEQYIAELYEYRVGWERGTPDSAFARRYLEFLIGTRKNEPTYGFGTNRGRTQHIKDRLKKELEK